MKETDHCGGSRSPKSRHGRLGNLQFRLSGGHHLVCTGTTGKLVREALNREGVFPEITCMNSGPMGGDAEIAAMVVRKEIDMAVFLIDDLNAQPHEADIMMLLRQCRIHNVPIACNRYSADLMITSTLWDDETYKPMEPLYRKFDRNKPE